MPSRSALAASITVTATLVSGMAAVAATTGFRPLAAASADAAPSLQAATSAPAAGPGVAPAASSVVPGTAAGPSAPPSSSSAAAAWLVALARGSGAPPTTGAGSSAPPSVADPTTPTTSPKPVAPPTTKPPTPTTTSPAPFNCAGSDNGLSEAAKQAREAYCHGQGFND